MGNKNITIKPNEDCRFCKDVYINSKCIGTTMADEKMSAIECYLSLINNWKIDEMERSNDLQINRSLNY